MDKVNRTTREQIITDKRNEIISQLFSEGFLLEEIGKMFKLKGSRISQIIKKVGKK